MHRKAEIMQRVLLISGHDPSTGGGMAADIRAAHSQGVYPASVLTAITAQNEAAINTVSPLSPELLVAQLEVVHGEPFGAGKIGMLGTKENSEALASWFADHPAANLVLDPVLRSTTGGELLSPPHFASLKELLPHVSLVTPNLIETHRLTGIEPLNESSLHRAAEVFGRAGVGAVLIKGGHREGPPVDILWQDGEITKLPGERVTAMSVRGTGCWLSTLIACHLAKNISMTDACRQSAIILRRKMVTALPLDSEKAIIL